MIHVVTWYKQEVNRVFEQEVNLVLASILLDRARSSSHRSGIVLASWRSLGLLSVKVSKVIDHESPRCCCGRPRQRYGGTTMLLRRCYACIRICLCYDAPRFVRSCPKTSWSFQVSSRSIKAHHELLRSTMNFVPTLLQFLKIPKS